MTLYHTAMSDNPRAQSPWAVQDQSFQHWTRWAPSRFVGTRARLSSVPHRRFPFQHSGTIILKSFLPSSVLYICTYIHTHTYIHIHSSISRTFVLYFTPIPALLLYLTRENVTGPCGRRPVTRTSRTVACALSCSPTTFAQLWPYSISYWLVVLSARVRRSRSPCTYIYV